MLTQYYTASSLDGFIAAEPEDGLAWLLTRDVDADGPQGYQGFIAEVGALCMGATTYQWLLDHAPGEWYYEMPCWVFTHRTFPETEHDIRFTTDPVPVVHAQMVQAAGGKKRLGRRRGRAGRPVPRPRAPRRALGAVRTAHPGRRSSAAAPADRVRAGRARPER